MACPGWRHFLGLPAHVTSAMGPMRAVAAVAGAAPGRGYAGACAGLGLRGQDGEGHDEDKGQGRYKKCGLEGSGFHKILLGLYIIVVLTVFS